MRHTRAGLIDLPVFGKPRVQSQQSPSAPEMTPSHIHPPAFIARSFCLWTSTVRGSQLGERLCVRTKFRLGGGRQVLRPPVVNCCADATEKGGGVADLPNVVDVLYSRGLIDAVTGEEGTVREACKKPLAVYVGFDPTADSLHLGNLMGIITLRWFQICGHRPVALVGGATGKVGDPSGKSQERPLLDDATIEKNLSGIAGNIKQVLVSTGDSSSPTEPMFVNNNDWIGQFSFLDFLRDVGKYARVGTMLAKDSVKTRLNSDEGMSFTEFTYQLLQGYDFCHLAKTCDVSLQAGGSDQWGNITAGIELGRKLAGKSLYGITFPLLTRSDGRKFGKSEGGAVWLSKDRLSPYEFYQYLYRTTDEDVCKFLRRLTFLDLAKIDGVEESMKDASYQPNTAQKILAEEVTRLVHGEEGVKAALAATAVAAPGKADGSVTLSADALEAISADMPSSNLDRSEVVDDTVVNVLVKTGLSSSKGEARRLIKNGGGYVNNVKVSSDSQTISSDDAIDDRLVLLGAGKKKKMLIRLEN